MADSYNKQDRLENAKIDNLILMARNLTARVDNIYPKKKNGQVRQNYDKNDFQKT